MKFSSFVDTTERGDRGWKQAQREGEDRVTLLITRLDPNILTSCARCSSNSNPLSFYIFICDHNMLQEYVEDQDLEELFKDDEVLELMVK
jgi:hypothetical protein